jgi:RNA polymerase sigma-70 factor (ECF subfamily)
MPTPPDIETLVQAHYDYIRRLAQTILDDGVSGTAHAAAEADEAAQDTFIAAHRALSGFRGDANVKTWLTRIAINQCRTRLRKRKSRRRLQKALESTRGIDAGPTGPEASALRAETNRRLWRAVDSLGEKHRIPVILRYVHELTIPEIAASLGLPEGTVHSRLHHAHRRLHALLAKETIHD